MMEHPKVYEAAGVGVPDDIYGEEIVAYLVVREGEILSEEEIKAHCVKKFRSIGCQKNSTSSTRFQKMTEGKSGGRI